MKHTGFSYLEVIIVIGIMGIIIAVSQPMLASFFLSNNFDVTQTMLVSSLKKAQQYALGHKNNQNWGVCQTSNKIRLYGGSCLSPNIHDDFNIPSSITISGLGDISFSPLRGEPNSNFTFIISQASKSKTININQAGGISVQ